MNIHNEVDRLIVEFDLSDCEGGDLGAFADTLSSCFNLPASVILAHVEMRAEVLSLVGSEMEEMFRLMERWAGERKK